VGDEINDRGRSAAIGEGNVWGRSEAVREGNKVTKHICQRKRGSNI